VAATSIFLILLIIAAFITSMASCTYRSAAIELRDWNDLDAIRNRLAENYVLMNNLDSSTDGYEELASSTANEGKGWDPIGGELPNVFRGTFDGNGHKICDLFINRPEERNVALFGTVGSVGWMGFIKNVGLVNFTVTGNINVAGLAGASWLGSSVTNCYATGTVTGSTGSEWVGGLVGYIHEGGSVTSCYFTGSVSGDSLVGGLMGTNDGGTVINCYAIGSVTGDNVIGGLVGRNWGTVIDSYATGSVTGGESWVGGLVGWSNNTVRNSYAAGYVTGNDSVGGLVGWSGGNVSDSYATGSVTGDNVTGGLVGWNDGHVSDCYATGNVNGNNRYAGGLVGYNNFGTVSDSHADGNVTVVDMYAGGLVGLSDSDVSNSYATGNVHGSTRVGGLMGRNDPTGTVDNCYSIGNVTGLDYVGGLIGENPGIVSKSFWNTETSGQGSSAGGEAKTTAQMKGIAIFTDAVWDIIAVANTGTRNPSYVWNIVDGETYPFLSWQPV
jgi:hypothetical protein